MSPEAHANTVHETDMAVGLSGDQTLSWTSTVHPDRSRRVTVRLWDGKTMKTVIDNAVAAPAP